MTRMVRGVLAMMAVVPMFLVAPVQAEAQGIGVGVKGGFLHTTFDTDVALDSSGGWMAGLFFGGNRPGTLGFMGEANVLAKTADSPLGKVTIHYFQVPALLRLNIGSSGTGVTDAIGYAIFGPALDLKIGEDLALGPVDEIESVDVSLVFGVGFEISRFIIEGRGTWGFRNIAKNTGVVPDTKTRTFAILAGLRFN
jgi:hypothetical protein